MEILKEKIIKYLKKEKKKMSLLELKKKFKIKSEKDLELLEKALKELELKGDIYLNKNNTYSILDEELGIVQGPIHISKKGNGTIETKDNIQIHVKKENLQGVFYGDIVTVNNIKLGKDRKLYGEIDKVIKRNKEQVSCICSEIEGTKIIYPYQSNSKCPITIKPKALKNIVDGEIILININNIKNYKQGKFFKSIGHKDDPDVDIKAILSNNEFDIDFSPKTLEELKKIPTEVEKKSYNENRVDLRDKNIFTIDDKDTKDIDDAISIEQLDNNCYKLSVHIADVSYYVPYMSSIFIDAYRRGTSVYANGTVNPMLDHKLSNGICSLNPNVDRLTKTCEMIIDAKGNIISCDIYKSIINSKKKMNYDDVNKILENNELVPGYEPFINDLKIMQKLSEKLEVAKFNRGYINFNNPDIKIKGSKETMKISLRYQKTAQKLVENFMLAANQSVAEYIKWLDLPLIYRVHNNPDEDKMKEIIEYMDKLGYKFKRCQTVNSNYAIQNMANQINYFDEYSIFSKILLKGMQKAKYDSWNFGHFGLALDNYTHFTSPIRRFPDLIVHTLLDLYLTKNPYDINKSDLESKISIAATHCSQKEKDADKVEREVNMMRMAEYMENHIGEEYEAVITNITPHGMFIKTKDYFEGKVELDDIYDKYFFNENTMSLINKRGHKSLRVGDEISCTVKSASKENRTINFKAKQLVYEKPKVLTRV